MPQTPYTPSAAFLEAVRDRVDRKTVILCEIEVRRCTRTYADGASGCGVALSLGGTGDLGDGLRCDYSYRTCQARATFLSEAYLYGFISADSLHAQFALANVAHWGSGGLSVAPMTEVHPLIEKVSNVSQEIDPEKAFTRTEKYDVRFADYNQEETPAAGDLFGTASPRGPGIPGFNLDKTVRNTSVLGSWWRRWRAMFPNFRNFPVRVLIGSDEPGFTRASFHQVWEGRMLNAWEDKNGVHAIAARDLFVDIEKKVPAVLTKGNTVQVTVGRNATVLTLKDASELTPLSGGVAYTVLKIMREGSAGDGDTYQLARITAIDTVTHQVTVTRGWAGTDKFPIRAGSVVEEWLAYQDIHPVDAFQDLCKMGGITEDQIDEASMRAARAWIGPVHVGRIIKKPTQIRSLVFQLLELFQAWVFVDEDWRVKLFVNRPDVCDCGPRAAGLELSTVLLTDSFTRADEAPLGSPWTIRETPELNLTSGVATRLGEPNTSGVLIYTHDTDGLAADGTGFAEAKIKFSTGVAAQEAGLVVGWSASNYVYATISTDGLLNYGRKGLSFAPVATTIAADTWYTLRLIQTLTGIAVFLDNVLLLEYAQAALGPRVVGIIVPQDDPTACVVSFDDFRAGEAMRATIESDVVRVVSDTDGSDLGVFPMDGSGTPLANERSRLTHCVVYFDYPIDADTDPDPAASDARSKILDHNEETFQPEYFGDDIEAQQLKSIASAWVRAGDFYLAASTSSRWIIRYAQAARRYEWKSDLSAFELRVGQLIDVDVEEFQTAQGAHDILRCVVVKKEFAEEAGTLDYAAQETGFGDRARGGKRYGFIGPDGLPDYDASTEDQRCCYAWIAGASAAGPLVTDLFTRANETPLAAPWTKREESDLNLAGNLVTQAGLPATSGVGERLYTHGTAGLGSNGTGFVQVDLRFSDDTATNQQAGIVAAWSASDYWQAIITVDGMVYLGRKGLAYSPTASVTITSNVWLTLRLEVHLDHVSVWVDGVQLLRRTATGPLSGTPLDVGLFVPTDNPALCVIDFDEFKAGTLAETNPSGYGLGTNRDDPYYII